MAMCICTLLCEYVHLCGDHCILAIQCFYYLIFLSKDKCVLDSIWRSSRLPSRAVLTTNSIGK